MIRFTWWKVSCLIKHFFSLCLLFSSSVCIFIENLFEVLPLLSSWTLHYWSLSPVVFKLHLPLKLLLLLKFLVQLIQSFMNGLWLTDLSKLFLYDSSWLIINSRMHSTLTKHWGLNFLVFYLLSDLFHEVILIFKKLIKIALLITFFNWIYAWVECTVVEVFILSFSLHLLNLSLAALIVIIHTKSEFLLIERFLEIKII